MPLSFEVFRHQAGDPHVRELINHGVLAARATVTLSEPPGHVGFGGEQMPVAQVAITDLSAFTAMLPPDQIATVWIPMIIEGQELPGRVAYSIELTYTS